MSDYMFMLESHLNAEQNRVVAEIQGAATAANVNLFLTGGAVRDMFGGFPIRDLDFTIEGDPLKLARIVATRLGGRVTAEDPHHRYSELLMSSGVTAQIAMSREERYAKPGGKPHVTPASIHEDLRRRDFTINAVALSLNRGSRGQLRDPTNGLGDLDQKQLRAAYPQAFHDDPSRMLRLVRFRHRFGSEVDERTTRQFENARLENLQRFIPPRTLFEELQQIADESAPGEILETLEKQGLMTSFSPALSGPKLNLQALAKLDKLKKMLALLPSDRAEGWRSFLHVLTEKLSPRERADLFSNLGMTRQEIDSGKKLQGQAKKLELALKSAKLKKPSQIYQLLVSAPPDEILYVLYYSQQRLVQDRIRNYLHKYLPLAQEITEAEVEAAGGKQGTPGYQKIRQDVVFARVDGKTKKPPPPPPPPPPGPAPRGRPPRAQV